MLDDVENSIFDVIGLRCGVYRLHQDIMVYKKHTIISESTNVLNKGQSQ